MTSKRVKDALTAIGNIAYNMAQGPEGWDAKEQFARIAKLADEAIKSDYVVKMDHYFYTGDPRFRYEWSFDAEKAKVMSLNEANALIAEPAFAHCSVTQA